MKVALHTDLFKSQPFDEALAQTAEAGYEYIELNSIPHWSPHVNFLADDSERLPNTAALLKKYGLKLAAVTLNTDLAALDEDERARNVLYCVRALRFCEALGADAAALYFSGNTFFDKAMQISALNDSLGRLRAVASETGVKLSVELHHGNFIDNTPEALDILKGYGFPEIGYLFCTAHVATYAKEDIFDSFEISRGLTNHIHISDTHRGVQNHQHLIPGHGDLDLDAFLALVKASGYDGVITLQMYSEAVNKVECARTARESIARHF